MHREELRSQTGGGPLLSPGCTHRSAASQLCCWESRRTGGKVFTLEPEISRHMGDKCHLRSQKSSSENRVDGAVCRLQSHRRTMWKLCLLLLSLPSQWEACKFSAPVLRVLESCAFGPGLLGSRRAQCVLLSQAPAALHRPCMALEIRQTLRGCPCKWGCVRGAAVCSECLTSFPCGFPPDINHFAEIG